MIEERTRGAVPYLIYVVHVESCRGTGLLRFHYHRDEAHALLSELQMQWTAFLGPPPPRAGCIGVTGALDQPLFMESRALYGSGGKKADALTTPLINPSVCSELSLRHSCGMNSDISNCPTCAFDPQRVLDKNHFSSPIIFKTHPTPGCL
jgi:hypothetical protein